MHFIRTGDSVGLEQFLSELSPSGRELAYAAEAAVGGPRSPILVTVRNGNPEIVRCMLKWLPEDQVIETCKFAGRIPRYLSSIFRVLRARREDPFEIRDPNVIFLKQRCK